MLGRGLVAGDVVCLYGNLGAGKTTLTKGIASALGIPENEIASASFVIVAEHEGRLPLYHVDLYRLEPGDVWETGLDDLLRQGGVTVVEWPDRGEAVLPDERINVHIDFEGEGRRLRIESCRPLEWRELTEAASNRTP